MTIKAYLYIRIFIIQKILTDFFSSIEEENMDLKRQVTLLQQQVFIFFLYFNMPCLISGMAIQQKNRRIWIPDSYRCGFGFGGLCRVLISDCVLICGFNFRFRILFYFHSQTLKNGMPKTIKKK